MKTTILKRKESMFNPLFLEDKQINHFVFFNAETGKELIPSCDINRWWGHGSNNDFPEVHFPFEIKRRNKTDLTKNEAFYRPYEWKYVMDKSKIVVYIPIQLLPDFKDIGNVFQFETETDKVYQRKWTFTVNAIETLHRLKGEELEYYESELKPCTLEIHDYYNHELKPLGKKIEKIMAALKTVDEKMTRYDIEKMLEVCEITVK